MGRAVGHGCGEAPQATQRRGVPPMLKLKLAAELFNHFLRLSPLQSTVQVVLVAFPDANSTDIVPSSVSAARRTPTLSNFTWHVCSSGASVLRASLADGETWRPWNPSRTSRRARVMRPNFGQNRRSQSQRCRWHLNLAMLHYAVQAREHKAQGHIFNWKCCARTTEAMARRRAAQVSDHRVRLCECW